MSTKNIIPVPGMVYHWTGKKNNASTVGLYVIIAVHSNHISSRKLREDGTLDFGTYSTVWDNDNIYLTNLTYKLE